ncbi:hypothetical protein FB45DRAFT_1086871 [Roridomyces roridus]|uniref:Uncharacterized protein n=1 Tax=Roridomyces roridus TaxID=1738132 RepID=A0AAD7FHT4_9AGAR|nr:hypothetical protein FB45DRAFT_1086871 [Roridomyces roridus]
MSSARRRGVLVLAMVWLAAADNLDCTGTGMSWYIDMVGETPCVTYQKLRRICNAEFAVGTMKVETPPDYCTDQVSDCCCNSVSFALSMLCLNCQQNISTGNGIDAGDGAYQLYLNGSTPSHCYNPVFRGLPTNIQTAVCNEKIKINDNIYSRDAWSSGAWYYVFSRDNMVENNAVNNNNSFTKCASTTVNASSSASGSSSTLATLSPSGTSQPSSTSSAGTSSSSSTLSKGAIAGIAIEDSEAEKFDSTRVTHPSSSAYLDGAGYTGKSWRDAGFSAVGGREAGPLPMKHRGGPENEAVALHPAEETRVLPGEPFLEEVDRELWQMVGERHTDAGPVGRSGSGRLPPAYRELIEQ